MTSATLESSNTTQALNPALYSLFAKASYCKNRYETKVSAQKAFNSWYYNTEENIDNPTWQVLNISGNDETGVGTAWGGFAAVAYKNNITNEIVIAFRGTDSPMDILISDSQIAFNLTPQQATAAVNFYEKVLQENPDSSISITGHSLGGALAQYVASLKHVPATTFNAPGVNIPTGGTSENIINYVNMNDFIGCLNTHIGETRYFLPDGMYNNAFKPHSDYIDTDFSKYITLPTNVKWTFGHAMALWGYDENNNNVSLKATLSAFVTENNLKDAAQIIEKYFGNYSRLETSFHYFSANKGFIIGSKENNLLIGKDSTADTIWGNVGNDTIYGQNGDDVIYGGYGDDIINAGKGNDIILGSAGNDEYIFVTGDGKDTFRDQVENIESSTGILYNTKKGKVNVNSHILVGGEVDTETKIIKSFDEGINYVWSGINNTNLIIKYGQNDQITVQNFINGDLGIVFSESTTTDKSEIFEQLKRDKQIVNDLFNNGSDNAPEVPKLKYKDENNVIYDVINCETTSKLLGNYGDIIGNGTLDKEGNFILVKEGEKISLQQRPVDYSQLVNDMKDIANGKEVQTTDLAIQSSDIYIPTSSTQGSPTMQDVHYQYTTKPSSTGFLLSGILTIVQMAANIVLGNSLGAIFIALNTGIAGKTVGNISSMIQSVLPQQAYLNINNKIGSIGIGINKYFNGSLTGAASNITGIGIKEVAQNQLTAQSLKNINKMNDGFNLLSLIVNKINWNNKDTSDFYTINPSTGSISANYKLDTSNFAEPDISTPENDGRFELNFEDRGCPLVFDIDGDGVETLNIDDTNIYFNTQNTDFSTKTGWISSDDAFLAIDKDGDGKITRQDELFGNEKTSGFDILKNYDSNGDGIIDANDTQFSNLRLWQDANENGITDEGELKTLAQAGIKSIKLNPSELNSEQNQNTVTGVSSFTKSDGKVGLIYNVNLAINKIYTQYTGDYELSIDVLDMPWLRGYGQVMDLQLKMSNDDALKAFVNELTKMDDAKAIYDKMDEFLAKWIGCEDIPQNASVNGINSREIAILNKYLNLGIEGEISNEKKVFIDNSYLTLKNKIYTNFIAQTSIGNAFEINYDYKTDSILYNDNTYENLITNLPNQKNFFASYIIAKVLNDTDALDGNKLAYTITQKGFGASLISYLNSGLQILESGEIEILSPNTPMYVIGTSGNDTITGTDNADIIYGMDGDDILIGGAGDDYLSGGNGNDLLIGGDGNDTMDGGEGDDEMQGGYGDDIYIYDGQGKDVIIDERWVKIARQEWYQSGWWIFKTWKYRWVYQDKLVDAGNDTVIFGDDVNEKDISISRLGNDLIFELKNTDDKLTIKNWYTTTEQRVENFIFADGFVINHVQIMNMYTDTENEDSIVGDDKDNFIISTSGNDSVSGKRGNDSIINYEGNTIYNFDKGDGNDIIMDYNGKDKIVLGKSIKEEDVKYFRNNKDLIISINNMEDSITVLNWFLKDDYKIETIEYSSSGSVVTSEYINEILSTTIATGYDDVIIGNDKDNIIDGLAGNDYIEGRGGNDTIIGGLGKDIMKGGLGNDIYYVDNIKDEVIENENEGNDTINASVSYELPDNVENLTLIGIGNINAKGNNLDNVIIGNDGDNILDGNAGTNTLKGGKGNDTYIINSSNANDIINENTDEGIDTVKSSISYTLNADNVENLILTGEGNIDGTGNNLDNYIEGNNKNNILKGGSGNDVLYGGGGSDVLYGGTGNDTYIIDTLDAQIIENSNEGIDTVITNINYALGNNIENLVLNGTESLTGTGNSLDNMITGNDFNNKFIGGLGNDILKGGKGSDVYIFNLGDGQDTIEENSPNSAAIDKIVFGSGISKNDIKFTREGYDLIISINNTNDKITIKNSNLMFGSRIERFEFADGTFINGNDLYTLKATGAKNNLYSDVSYLNINSKASRIDREYYEEGNIKSETFYNEQGKISSENFYYLSGVLKQSNTYTNGLISKEIKYADNKAYNQIETQREFTYNSNNQLTQIKNYIGSNIDTTEKYTYNAAGQKTELNIYFGSSTNIKNKIKYTYDTSKRLLTETKYASDKSTITDKISYTYDIEGNVSRKLIQFGFNKPNPKSSGMEYKWTLITGEDINYTFTNGKITREVTTSAYMESVTKKVGTMSYTYSDYVHTRTTKELLYSYDENGNITRILTKIGYDKPTPKTSGMEHVWTLRSDEDIRYTYINGKITKEVTTSAYMESVTKKVGTITYTYSDYINTHKTKEVTYDYDEIGNIKTKETKVGYYKSNPTTSGMESIWSYRTNEKLNYTYNDNHQLSNLTIYGSYADLVSKKVGTVTYTYYEYNTRKSEEIRYTYNDDCKITSEKIYKYKYDNSNKWTSYLAQNKTYQYDAEGYLQYFKQYNDGNIVEAYKYEYVYDKNNCLVKQIIYKGVISNNNVSSYNKYQEVNINSYYNNLIGSSSNDTLNGSNQSDNLKGNAGNDVLYGNAGNDILDGGEGADLMVGGKGDDTYLVDNINDIIIEHEHEGNDTVKASIDYTLNTNLENLSLMGNENLIGKGNEHNNIIHGNSGNNMLYGYDGNDIIYGGAGNDTIYGGNNNDIISGDAGNDTLYGGDGDDTYIFKNNDGIDIISDSSGKNDKILFNNDVEKENIAIFQSGNNLIIDYGSAHGEDVITIISQNTKENSVERIELSDGNYITNYDINLIIQNMTAYAQNNAIEFTGIESVKNNADLMNLVSSAWHN